MKQYYKVSVIVEIDSQLESYGTPVNTVAKRIAFAIAFFQIALRNHFESWIVDNKVLQFIIHQDSIAVQEIIEGK